MTKQTEIEMEKEIVDLKFDHDLKCHEMRMEELKFIRETESISHENAMSRMRIKSTEIKRAHDRKVASSYPRGKSW